ncbi:conserved membrane protein of unknown function [Tenacibaculum jejuense]|uniref:Uncharacterized protein n=1 Tax=Tenacibaculum jejuense TaxID=584609 RepID=A0A238U7J8_9FLAO|nr:conserved membrane protein of unknown function [Tenacibaculum jejuense]
MKYSNNSVENRFVKKKIYNEFFVMFVFGLVICTYLLYQNSIIGNAQLKASDIPKGLLIFQGFYIGAALVAGWKALNSITPRIFLVLPVIGWVIYFILKLFLSSIIGVFILPIRLIQRIRQLYLIKRQSNTTAQ